MKDAILWVGIHGSRETVALLEQYILALSVTLAKRDGYCFPQMRVEVDEGGVMTSSVTPDLQVSVHQVFNEKAP